MYKFLNQSILSDNKTSSKIFFMIFEIKEWKYIY